MKIGWFPGHMAKARKQITAELGKIDLVVEILDARLPMSSANPLLQELRGDKPCIKLLNKQDLADPEVTDSWIACFERDRKIRALPIEARQRHEAVSLLKLCRSLVPGRGRAGRILRVLVVGIPNVGKSTLINSLAGKKIARVGDRPAVTTCPQQIDLRNGIHLHDTPGLLWPDLSDQAGAYRLAASGAIGDNAIDFEETARFAAGFLLERYPENVKGRYRLADLPEKPNLLIEEIGRRRGCLAAGGTVDTYRAAEIFLRELRGGQLGRISLEDPGRDLPSGIEAG